MAAERVAGPASRTPMAVFWARVPPGPLQRVSARTERCRRCARRAWRPQTTPGCRPPPLPTPTPPWGWLGSVVKGPGKGLLAFRHAEAGDPFAKEIVGEGARQVDVLIRSLVEFGAPRVSLLGGLASRLVQWLSPDVLPFLSPPEGDAVAGALLLARREGHAATEPRRQRKVRRYAD